MRRQQYEFALADFVCAIELQPNDARIYRILENLLATCPDARIRNTKKAVDYTTRGRELSGWQDFKMLLTLARSHAEAGKPERGD